MTTETQLQAAIRTAQRTAVESLEHIAQYADNAHLQIKAAKLLLNTKVEGKPKKRRGGDSVKPEKPIPF